MEKVVLAAEEQIPRLVQGQSAFGFQEVLSKTKWFSINLKYEKLRKPSNAVDLSLCKLTIISSRNLSCCWLPHFFTAIFLRSFEDYQSVLFEKFV